MPATMDITPPAQPAGDQFRSLSDKDGLRSDIYNAAVTAVGQRFPVENATHRLEVSDLAYEGNAPTPADEKKTLLARGRLHRPLKGTLNLIDKATGKVVDTKRTTLLHVPHYTSRGLLIYDGTEYSMKSQQRLRPGVYSRVRQDGGLEAQFNVKPGTGGGFRVEMEPRSGVFKLRIGQSTSRLYPLLRSLGVDDASLKQAWGEELFTKNSVDSGRDDGDLEKVVSKLGKRGVVIPKDQQAQALKDILARAELDPQTTKRTLGEEHAHVSPAAILSSTRKLLAIGKGAASDNRDSQSFQSLHTLDDLLAERIRLDPEGMARTALWKASKTGSLSHINSGLLNKSVHSIFKGSGLAQAAEQVNQLELYDLQHAITRMGEGGIQNEAAVSRDARGVQTSYFGVISPSRAPESSRAGLDLRAAGTMLRGPGNQAYAQLKNVRTGELSKVPAGDIDSITVAFSNELDKPGRMVRAIKNGALQFVDRAEVQYEMPHGTDMSDPVSNLVPLLHTSKGQRFLMGTRMQTQALPLDGAEAPLVRAAAPDGSDLHHHLGKVAGAVRSDDAGIVVSVTPDYVEVQTPSGLKRHHLYNNYPNARKTTLHNTATVKVGDHVEAGGLLAKSNQTDDKGHLALGRNLRIAFQLGHSDKSSTYEDSYLISESTAKKLSSEHMYGHDFTLDKAVKSTKTKDYTALFGDRFSKEQFANLDDDGVIKPGTKVMSGDPLVVGIGRKKEQLVGALMQGKDAVTDLSKTWDHHAPGVVTDVVKDKDGYHVYVKSYDTSRVSDKLCYSDDTEVLTAEGWKTVADITAADRLAVLAGGSELVYMNAVAVHSYDHVGRMYSLETTQASLLVTDNHRLYAAKGCSHAGHEKYGLYTAEELYGTQYKLKNNAEVWTGTPLDEVRLPGYSCGAGRGGVGVRVEPERAVATEQFMFVLGCWLSEGNLLHNTDGSGYGFDITQIKPANRIRFEREAARLGLTFGNSSNQTKYRMYSRHWYNALYSCVLDQSARDCYSKSIPSWVFNLPRHNLLELFKWLMWGDGHTGKTHSVYTTTSKRLADDVQRLALHLGWGANIRYRPAYEAMLAFNGSAKRLTQCAARYDVMFYFKKNRPTINHAHVRQQSGQTEQWVNYAGKVYCPELPEHHVLYVRRRGKAVWCGNSNRFGGKGVIGEVVPDDQMPVGADGKHIEVISNALGGISRINPNAVMEALLGKVAAKTGKPYVLPAFNLGKEAADYCLEEAAKHGVAETEDLYDPRTGKTIKGVMTGIAHIMKLHHTAEAKLDARDSGSYSMDDTPSTHSKRIGLLDDYALLSSGATEFLKDAKLIRGQRNDDYWRKVRQGETPDMPTKSFANERFRNLFKAAGVNFRESGSKTQLVPMTDAGVDAMASHEVTSSDTFDFQTLKPIPGGLFDTTATGGADGRKWSKIVLPHPIPNPMFELPIMKMLGLTKSSFEAILSGKETLHGKTGPAAIQQGLADINIDREMTRLRGVISSGKGASRDSAIKVLGYLDGLKKQDAKPSDLMITKMPVLPPKFRPIARMAKQDLIHDANYLYHDLLEAAQNVKDTASTLGEAGDQYLTMYKAAKAVAGVHAPVSEKHAEQGLRGMLKLALGVGDTPKMAAYQRKVIGTAVDSVGRGVITSGADMDMDTVELPETMAWEIFKPYTVRELVRMGLPEREAVKAVRDQTKVAEHARDKVMADHPVVLNRAPSLHRGNYTSAYAKVGAHDGIRLPNVILKGLGGDHDGDAINVHVPSSPGAIKDAKEKLLPSKNLLSPATFEAHLEPGQDHIIGAFVATKPDLDEDVHIFRTPEEAKQAYKRGEIGLRTPVRILSHGK